MIKVHRNMTFPKMFGNEMRFHDVVCGRAEILKTSISNLGQEIAFLKFRGMGDRPCSFHCILVKDELSKVQWREPTKPVKTGETPGEWYGMRSHWYGGELNYFL